MGGNCIDRKRTAWKKKREIYEKVRNIENDIKKGGKRMSGERWVHGRKRKRFQVESPERQSEMETEKLYIGEQNGKEEYEVAKQEEEEAQKDDEVEKKCGGWECEGRIREPALGWGGGGGGRGYIVPLYIYPDK